MAELRRLPLSLVFFALVLAPGQVRSQPTWVDSGESSAVILEVNKPFLSGEDRTTFASSIWYLSLFGSVGERIRLVGELPVVHGGFDELEGETTLGNPYVGVEIGSYDTDLKGQLGLRIPLTSTDPATELGFFTDVIERPGTFVEDQVAILTRVSYTHRSDGRFGLSAFLGPNLVFSTVARADGSDLLLTYGARAAYNAPLGSVGGGFSGVWFMDEGSLTETSLHQLGITGQLNLGIVRPGAVIRIPVDQDYRDIVDLVLGLNVTVIPGSGDSNTRR